MTYRMRVILVLLCVAIELAYCQTANEKQAIDKYCQSPLCSCCLDTVTCTADGQCGGQCKDGYFGRRCWRICPDNCISCEDPYNPTGTSSLWDVPNCTHCIAGHYSTSVLFQCQFDCPNECKKCTSPTECTSCKDGYTLEGTMCRQCKTGCAYCLSYEICTQCDGVSYNLGGASNDLNCVACSNGCNTQCDNGTGACSCVHGFDGARCDRCMSLFSGTNCDQCSLGYYGTFCNQTCPSNCKHNECDRSYGTCTQGCTENFNGVTCNVCMIGRYGHDCTLQCPENCDGACNRSSGYCQGCKTIFVGNTCDECSVGKHGPDCSLACSSDCKDNKCDRGTGSCDSCPDGSYGALCNTLCSPNCLQTTCQQKTGACIGGCTPGYSGDMCCLKGSNCKSCSSVSQCVECLPGKYDEICNSECPANCADNICNKNNGTCIKCTYGFQGHYCTLAMAATESADGTPGAAIGGGVTGALLVIIVVVVLLIVYMRRRGRMCYGPRGSDIEADTPTYINDTSSATQENRKAVDDKTRKLQKYQKQHLSNQKHRLRYQQKEEKYAEKAVRIQHELNELKGQRNNQDHEEDGTGTVNSTYESLDPQATGGSPYAALGTK